MPSMGKHTIFVFANLKPSQIKYKILPLSHSENVEKVIILRKDFMEVRQEKVVCYSLPGLMKIRPFYWFVVPFYGIYLINRYHVTLILNYNIFPHGFNAFFASLFTCCPVIFSEINEDTIHYHSKPLVRPLITAILSHARYLTVPGSRTKHYWEKNGYQKIATLHSTIDTDFFKPDNSIVKSFDFIYIGEFNKNKRPDLILECLAELRNEGIKATLCIIGFGSLLDTMKKIISENDLHDCVTFVSTNNVIEYIHRSRIFVMASLSEGIPCALMESMACELLAVVPDVGDIADVVKLNQNGIIYDGSREELKKWMKEILLHYDDFAHMRMNARSTIINEHSYQTATTRWDNLLTKIE
jgi:glycosyltransferase involved in cell wall biosynthesis